MKELISWLTVSVSEIVGDYGSKGIYEEGSKEMCKIMRLVRIKGVKDEFKKELVSNIEMSDEWLMSDIVWINEVSMKVFGEKLINVTID